MLPHIPRAQGGRHGATVLGVHVEGPFISRCAERSVGVILNITFTFIIAIIIITTGPPRHKKGAHPEEFIVSPEDGIRSIEAVYGPGLGTV